MASQTTVSNQAKPKRRWVVVGAVGLALVFLVVSIVPGWLSGRWAQEAEALLAAGDLGQAETKARAALEVREENTRAMRVLIAVYAGTNKAEAIQLSHRLMETDRATFEDGVRFTELIQAVGDAEGARSVVERLASERPTDAEVILLEARQAALDGNGDLALLKVEDALSLDPGMRKAMLLRGLLLTQSADPVRRLQGKDALVDASVSDQREGIEALMALLVAGDLNVYSDERRLLADRLLNHPLAGVSEKLMALQNLILSNPEGQAGYVGQAEALFEESDNAVLLVRWLIAIGGPEEALERIPDDFDGERAYFDARISALMRLGRYGEVIEAVRSDDNFLTELEKATILIYLEEAGIGSEGDDALWDEALSRAVAEDRADVLFSLAQYSQARGQIERSMECYRRAFELDLRERETLQLWQQYFLVTLNQPDMEISRQVAEQIVERFPDEASPKNNLSYLSILMGRDLEAARVRSEGLVSEHPDIAGFRTTLALGLLKEGAAADAWAVLDVGSIDWDGQDAPSRIIVALVAQAVGRDEMVQGYVADVDPSDLLPAERDLLSQIR